MTSVVLGFGVDVPRVGDLASLAGGWPSFAIPMVRSAGDAIYYLSLCANSGRDWPD